MSKGKFFAALYCETIEGWFFASAKATNVTAKDNGGKPVGATLTYKKAISDITDNTVVLNVCGKLAEALAVPYARVTDAYGGFFGSPSASLPKAEKKAATTKTTDTTKTANTTKATTKTRMLNTTANTTANATKPAAKAPAAKEAVNLQSAATAAKYTIQRFEAKTSALAFSLVFSGLGEGKKYSWMCEATSLSPSNPAFRTAMVKGDANTSAAPKVESKGDSALWSSLFAAILMIAAVFFY